MKTHWRFSVYPLLSVLVLLIDQWIKVYVRTLPLYEAFFTVPGILELTHHTNTGAAFSMLSGHADMIAVFSALLLILLMVFLGKTTRLTTIGRISVVTLIGAGASNLIDRILFGGVTDYIRLLFIHFPVFNLADICITCSVMIMSILIMTGRLDKQPEEFTHGSKD